MVGGGTQHGGAANLRLTLGRLGREYGRAQGLTGGSSPQGVKGCPLFTAVQPVLAPIRPSRMLRPEFIEG